MNIEKIIKKNFDLTPFTTFKIGGRAEYFLVVKNKQELISAIQWAKKNKFPLSILAGGSNILITKKKINGLVLKISGNQYFVKKNYITAWAGTSLTKLSKVSTINSLTGLEWAWGIPGSLGGAVRGNAGAYGSDISKQVFWIEAYDMARGRLIKLNNQACNFSYRHSIFKDNKNLVIVSIKLKLKHGRLAEIKKLAQKNFNNRILTLPNKPSAGCIFKNLELKQLKRQNNKLAKDLVAKGLLRGNKLGTGYLIDQLGFKGKAVGGAKVSEKHANFIISTGKTNAKDVIKLVNVIKKKIKNIYKISIEEEIQYF
jgi:UDP-N-acetylmuramate dehydrogenase